MDTTNIAHSFRFLTSTRWYHCYIFEWFYKVDMWLTINTNDVCCSGSYYSDHVEYLPYTCGEECYEYLRQPQASYCL